MDTPIRFGLPVAYADPAFQACLHHAISTAELVAQFDRLYGASLSTCDLNDGDARAFVTFVHDGIYLRLPDEAIHSLRAASLSAVEA